MDVVGEIKIIRITNEKNGLFKELDFNKYTKEDIVKMIEFYNNKLLNFSLNIYDKFTIKREARMIKMMIKTQKSEYQEIEDLEVANDTRFEITDDIRAFIKHTDKVPLDIEDLSTDYIMINAYREINRKIINLVSFIDRAKLLKDNDILSLIDKRIKRITLFSNDDFILFAR